MNAIFGENIHLHFLNIVLNMKKIHLYSKTFVCVKIRSNLPGLPIKLFCFELTEWDVLCDPNGKESNSLTDCITVGSVRTPPS